MRQILKRIVETLVVIFGNCIYAFGIAMFILPSGLITGGTTGIALFVNDVFHTPVTVFVFVFNTIMFLIGFFCIRVEVCGKYDCQHIQLPDCTRTDHKAAWGLPDYR